MYKIAKRTCAIQEWITRNETRKVPDRETLWLARRRNFLFLFRLPGELAGLTTLPNRGFLIIAVTFQIAGQPLTLTKTLKTFEHLLNGFISPRPDLDQCCSSPSLFSGFLGLAIVMLVTPKLRRPFLRDTAKNRLFYDNGSTHASRYFALNTA